MYLSIYYWHPGMDGSLFKWSKGEVVEFTAPSTKTKYLVRVDSELMTHLESPSGKCYECVFPDSGRWALDPTYFAPTGERLAGTSAYVVGPPDSGEGNV